MPEEYNPHEIKEQIELFERHRDHWERYLALTTAIIAVIAALVSLYSSYYADLAILEKNNAILFQNQASDQWNYYQAKGVKKNLAEGFGAQFGNAAQQQEAARYAGEQEQIKSKAEHLEEQVKEKNEQSERLFETHHKLAVAVTLFQIAIALSAIGALLKSRWFWFLSVVGAIVGIACALHAAL